MVWKKSTSTHVADWRAFSLTFSSLRQLAVFGLILGLIWGIFIVKFHGLPSDGERAFRSKLLESKKKAADLKKEICNEHPTRTICQPDPHAKGGGIEQLK